MPTKKIKIAPQTKRGGGEGLPAGPKAENKSTSGKITNFFAPKVASAQTAADACRKRENTSTAETNDSDDFSDDDAFIEAVQGLFISLLQIRFRCHILV